MRDPVRAPAMQRALLNCFPIFVQRGKTFKLGAGRDDQSSCLNWAFLFFNDRGVKVMHLCGDQIGFTAQNQD